MRIGNYHVEFYKWSDKFVFDFSIMHKYWYLWDICICNICIEICRTDWNKCYKDSCVNYTDKCKYYMDCGQDKDCYEQNV